MSLLEESLKRSPEWVEFRRDLHRYPELSFEESRTASKVAERLSRLGIDFKTGVGGHGIVADIRGGDGPTIALRADMDALPIQEETGLDFASENPGVMHACGHDAHTTILIGAAELLTGREFPGTVRLLFQSAEEIVAGARQMIEQGALEGVREIYGLHNLPNLESGKIGTRYGSLMGSVDRIEITLEGKGGHGAVPNQTIDPIVGASAVVMALQQIVSRELSPFDACVVTIGSLQAGETNNVIPPRALMTGTVRTFDPQVRAGMPERIRRVVEQVAEGYRCRAEVKYISQVPVLVNHDENVKYVEETADALIGRENRIHADPTLAGEDFSLYLEKVPGCFFWLGSGPERDASQAYGLHHPKFSLDERCIPVGSALLAEIALRRLDSTGKSQ